MSIEWSIRPPVSLYVYTQRKLSVLTGFEEEYRGFHIVLYASW